MSQRDDDVGDNDNSAISKYCKRTSSGISPNAYKEVLKVHASIYMEQKKINDCKRQLSDNTATNDTGSIPVPDSPEVSDNFGPTGPKLQKVPQNINDEPKRISITTENIEALYEKTLVRLKDGLARDAVSVCLTIDYWQAAASMGQDFVTVTAHYIDKDFEMHHMLLACFNETRRNNRCVTWIVEHVAEDLNITEKVTHVVAKYSYITDKAIKLLDSKYMKHFSWCFLESLNQLVTKAIIPTQNLFKKIITILNNMKRNTVAFKYFCDYQTRMTDNTHSKLLVRPVGMCWYSRFLVLERFTSLKQAIKACMEAVQFDHPVISDEEWEIANQLYKVLKPFHEVTSSTRKSYIPGSMIIILTNTLKSICNDFLVDADYSNFKEPVKNVVKSMQASLTDLFPVESIEFCTSLGMCTFLDPRFKIYGFENVKAVELIKSHVHDLIIELLDKKSSEKEPEIEDITVWKRFDVMIKKYRATHELNMYINEALLPRKGPDGNWNDPAKWWRDRKAIYPNLSEIYRMKCNIVGTTIHCEKILSESAKLLYICDTRRSIEQLAFLNDNLDGLCDFKDS